MHACLGKLIHLSMAPPLEIMGGILLGALRFSLFFCMISYFLMLFPLDFLHHAYQIQSWSGHTLVRAAPKIHERIKGLWNSYAVR